MVGHSYTGKVVLDLGKLSAEEIGVEMVHTRGGDGDEPRVFVSTLDLECTKADGSVAEYTFVQNVDETGVFDIGFRIYPKNELIPAPDGFSCGEVDIECEHSSHVRANSQWLC
jgi:phosphorylase/glycogen(starch) synthase